MKFVLLKRAIFVFVLSVFSLYAQEKNEQVETLSKVPAYYASLKELFQPSCGNMYIPAKKMLLSGNFVTKGIRKCPFCMQMAESDDRTNVILWRSSHCIVALSFYPYSDGHILVLPQRHVGSLSELSYEERVDVMELVTVTTDILKEVLHAEGVNIGINMGEAAGASIPGHLHVQLVPRWEQYRNTFLQIYGNLSVITYSLPEMYDLLAPKYREKLGVYKGLMKA